MGICKFMPKKRKKISLRRKKKSTFAKASADKKEEKEVSRYNIFTRLTISEDKDFFIENLAMLLGSGMDMLSALRSIKDEVRTKQMRMVIEDIIDDTESGFPLSYTLERRGIFYPHVISLIKIGEESGRLSENLKIIVEQQRKTKSFRSKLRSAITYPLIVFFLTLIVGMGITWFILPRLAQVFSQLKIDLPIITKVLIVVGSFLGEWGSIAVPIFLLSFLLFFYFIFFFKKTNFIGQAFLSGFPTIGRMIQGIELAKMGHVLGDLLEAGIPIIEAVESLKNTTTHYRYRDFYIFLKDRVEEGNSLQKSFGLYPKIKKIMPSFIQQMIVAGEDSGNLAETLVRIGDRYEEKTENITKNLVVILEPIFLVIVWFGVVFVALGVILPIYSLVGGL